MKREIKDIKMIQRLVGNISESDLRYVDYYISKDLGIFIPSVGFCQYAIKPQHTHPSYSFILFFSEEQSIIHREINMKPNHYLAASLSPDIPHEEEETDFFTRYIAILISKEFYEKQYSIYSQHRPKYQFWKQFLINYDIMFYLKKFMLEYENGIVGNKNVLSALTLIITNYLIRSILNVNDTYNCLSNKIEINRVVEFMHQNFREDISNFELAKVAKMSNSHFIRVFKEETDYSPQKYLLRIRIEKAKKLLKGGTKNITEISFICGFNSPSHFSSSFIKHTGITPSQYKNIYCIDNQL